MRSLWRCRLTCLHTYSTSSSQDNALIGMDASQDVKTLYTMWVICWRHKKKFRGAVHTPCENNPPLADEFPRSPISEWAAMAHMCAWQHGMFPRATDQHLAHSRPPTRDPTACRTSSHTSETSVPNVGVRLRAHTASSTNYIRSWIAW